ncbi:MAG: nucleoside 2-deoxyribosyltransferase [Selenomonadaceae bacterium]
MNKKVYFAGSIRGGRQDAELYRKIISAINETDKVLTEHVGDLSLSLVERQGDKAIYEQDTAWLRESDIVIAECSQPSLGVGYELAYAEKLASQYIYFTGRALTSPRCYLVMITLSSIHIMMKKNY